MAKILLMNNNDVVKHILARKPSDLTIAWAQGVARQHDPGAVITKVDIVSVDIGTTTRVRLDVVHNSLQSLPRRWFVKLPSMHWRARLITALPRLLHAEARFYQEIAQLIPLAMPTCLMAQSRRGRGVNLVLADVTESGAVPSLPGDALTVAQAAATIEHLARFHALFWNKAHVDPAYRWLSGPVRRLEDRLGTALAVPLMRRGLRLAGVHVDSALRAPALRYARQRRQAMRFLAAAPQTLIHHDCHPGNLFWNEALSQPGFLDWQLVRIGEGVSDVAYFLATALDPETRRRHDAELLARYAQALESNGVADVDGESLMLRYRAHLVYPFEAMLVTLAIGGMMGLDSNLELIRRTAAAVSDLDAFAALPL